jgi:hypothetical protein
VQGGLQLQTCDSADKWSLAALDNLALYLESLDTKLPPPRITGDDQAYDSPLKGCLYLSPGQYNDLITDASAGNNLRAFQAAVEQRQKWAKGTALFMGECGIWRGILVKKMEHTIAFNAGSKFQYVPVANRLTATEAEGTVAAGLSTTHRVERAVLLGAQALARAEGSSNSGVQAAIIENKYNAGRNYEYMGEFMGGEAKFRFAFPNAAGDAEATDNGVFVIDSVSRIVGN